MMSKRMLINYLLLVLIIIFTWIGTKYPITEDQKIHTKAITTLNPKNITDINVETADGSIVLKKQGLSWMIQKPIEWFADNIAAERLTTLASLEPGSKLSREQIDLSTLGLRIPKAVVTLNQKSIYFGDTNQIGNRRYLMVDPNVYLAADIHYIFISEGMNGLVDKRLLPSHLSLKELHFNQLTIHKKESGWASDKPQDSSADIQQLIKNWQQKPAKIKLYDKSLNPLQKIKAVLQNDKQIEFFVLSISPEIIIARPDLNIQYHFSDQLYYELLALPRPGKSTNE